PAAVADRPGHGHAQDRDAVTGVPPEGAPDLGEDPGGAAVLAGREGRERPAQLDARQLPGVLPDVGGERDRTFGVGEEQRGGSAPAAGRGGGLVQQAGSFELAGQRRGGGASGAERAGRGGARQGAAGVVYRAEQAELVVDS